MSGFAAVVDKLHAVQRMNERAPGCRTLVVSRGRRELTPSRFHVVSGVSDMMKSLREGRANYDVVVLTGQFAENQELVSFLSNTYPALRVLSGRADEEPDTYLPTFS